MRSLFPSVFLVLTLVISSMVGNTAMAASSSDMAQTTASSVTRAAPQNSFSHGEIQEINRLAAKVTIKHGELKNLDMPAMTMVFRVKEPSMLERLKVGDQVSFIAEQIGGHLAVVAIEPMK